MEGDALGAFQEDLERLESESGSAELQSGKPEAEAASAADSESVAWIQGVTDDGLTYYYNTLTGEAQWEKPEEFPAESTTAAQTESQNEKSSSSPWMEALSPDGYTYYYNTETGESSWAKPVDYSDPDEPDSTGGVEEQGDSLSPQPEPLSGEERSSGGASDLGEPEDFGELNILKRTNENSQDEEEEEVEDKNENDNDNEDDNVRNEDAGEKNRPTAQQDKEEEEDDESPAKKPRTISPNETCEQTEEEQASKEQVDPSPARAESETAAPVTPNLPRERKTRTRASAVATVEDRAGTRESLRRRKLENGKTRSHQRGGGD